jgi:putative cell wall-binding protein
MTITNTGRRLALVGLLALVASLMPLSSASAAHLTGVTNLDADNNVDAALQWSNPGGFPDGGLASGARDPQYVLIGRDDVFADNLASGALQGAEGPLLLTDSDSLDADVAAEIERLGVDEAVILGGVNAISEGVEAELNDLVSTVSRLEGETRTETAIAITADSGATTAILARSEGEGTAAFADSLAAGAWAAADDFGVLLTQTAELTETTADFLATGQIDEVIIVGGESAVSTDVEDAVAAIDGVTVSRVAGDNRAGTAVAIAEARGFDSAVVNDGVILSEGFIDDAWADGFPAAATSALEGYPVLLSNGDDLPPETATYFEDTTSNATNLVCGPYATAAACDAAAAIIGTVELALDLTSITVGDDVTGTVGGNVATLTVFGCGFGSEEAPVAVTINEDGTFNLGPLPASEDETCTLTFTAADADGN